MKKLYIIGAIVLVLIIFWVSPSFVNVGFAEKIIFEYDYDNIHINQQITDKADFEILKKICNGIATDDSPSCGFGGAKLVFKGKGEKVILYLASDECDLMQLNDSNQYFSIGQDNRVRLIKLLLKYGAKFPCI